MGFSLVYRGTLKMLLFATRLMLSFLILICFGVMSQTALPQKLTGASLSDTKISLKLNEMEREYIIDRANFALSLKPISITNFVSQLSQGGVNDFYSNGDYWWPDPKKENGMPYVLRDGQSNPNNFNHHRIQMRDLSQAIGDLASGSELTGEAKYAIKASQLLSVFFVDAKTRMNPSLQFAQAIPGITPGRGVGVIDSLHLIDIPKSVQALRKNPAFPHSTDVALQDWFKSYLNWMLTSKNGIEESRAKNNHSVAFWLQVAVFAEFLSDQTRLDLAKDQFKNKFMIEQLAFDGSFPQELARTKPYGYSIFQLDNMAALCQVLSTPEDNLWTYETKEGKSMLKALHFLTPYIKDKANWPYAKDIQAFEGWPVRQPFLLFSALEFQNPEWLQLWHQLPMKIENEEVRRNVAVLQPWLWIKKY
jgi:Alginate lyase